MDKEITLDQFINIYESGDIKILDIREPWEAPAIKGENVIHIPMNQIPQLIEMIPREEDLIVICQHAIRSTHAISYLETQHGFDNLINLRGGVSSYVQDANADSYP